MMKIEPSDGVLPRKLRSEAHLAQLNIPVDTDLPPLPSAWSSPVRAPEAIAARAICLCLCAAKAEGLEAAVVADLVIDFGVGRYLRPPETAFLYGQSDSESLARRFQWGYEACGVLLWTLGRLDALQDPVARSNPQEIAGIITGAGSIDGLAGVAREAEEILDAADLTYRFLAVCRQAGPPYQQVPGGVICAVVHQRQHAFQWLLDPERLHWEDVVVPL
jgi:hypothetical protein